MFALALKCGFNYVFIARKRLSKQWNKKDDERLFFVSPPRQNLKWMSIKREKVVRGKNECIHLLDTFQLIDGNI